MPEQNTFQTLLSEIKSQFENTLSGWLASAGAYQKTAHRKAITLSDWNDLVNLLVRTEAYVRAMYPVINGFDELGDAFSAEVQAIQRDAASAAEDAEAAASDVHAIANVLKNKTVEHITLTDDFRIKFVFSDESELITESVRGPVGPEGPAGGVSMDTLLECVQEALANAKDYTDAELAAFDFIKVVPELPEEGLPNKIYLVPKSGTQTQDLFDEYLWVNGSWEWVTTKQVEVDVTGKLDKVTTSATRARVYAVSKAGNQYLHTISGSTEHHNGALPVYTNVGTIRSAAPQVDDDLATKRYVDTFAGGGGLDVVNLESSSSFTIPDGRGALIIATSSMGGMEIPSVLFALPPVNASPVTEVMTTTNGVTLTAYQSISNWSVSVSGENWLTIIYI